MRLGEGVSWPPQGKVPRVSSMKPRAAGERSWKWAVTMRGRRVKRKANCMFAGEMLGIEKLVWVKWVFLRDWPVALETIGNAHRLLMDSDG